MLFSKHLRDLSASTAIVGRKGSSKKGGSASDASNTLRSKARASMVELLSEGEIVGLVDEDGVKLTDDHLGRAIFFDQTPVENADGTINFKNVIMQQHTGLPDETHFNGTSGVETPVSVDVQVKKNTGPVQRTIVDTNADSVRVIVRLPALVKQNKKKGRLEAASVAYAFEIRSYGGAWNRVLENHIDKQKTTSAYQIAHKLSLPKDGSPWDVRMVRLTDDSEDDNLQNDTYWEGYVVIVDGKFTYPHSAAISLEVNAEDMGQSIPDRSFRIKGLKVNVPSNYDPATRAYTGIWNGTFKIAWTDNPAWIFYDLLVNDRYGLGQFVKAEIVDKWSLYTIAQYCDQLVPSGYKNGDTGEDILEPRFTYNGVINSRDEAYTVLQQITTAWRGMAFWSIGQVFATADMPADPIKLVSPANVVDGEFNYSGTAKKARHSVCLVKWNDPDDFYRPATEVVIDDVALRRWGWREKSLQLNGCTSRGLAHRYGKWVLDVEQNETETVEYKASWDHADVRPGDIIAVSDPNKSQVRTGGRIKSHVGNVVTLDAPFEPAVGATYSLMLTMPDGSLEKKAIQSFSGAAVTMAEAFSHTATVNAMFAISGTDIVPRQYRVLTVSEEEKNIFKITALTHDPLKYARIEQNIVFDPLPYSRPKNVSLPPINLQVKEVAYTLNGVTKSRLLLSWTPNPNFMAKAFKVKVITDQDGEQDLGTRETTSIELDDVQAGTYTFLVSSISYTGLASLPAEASIEATGPEGIALPTVTDLKLVDRPTSNEFVGRDVHIGWSNNFAGSSDPDADDSELTSDISPLYSHNIVKVYDNTSGSLLRTQRVQGERFDYTYDLNRADSLAATLSDPCRSLRFEVSVFDTFGRECETPATAIFTNPAPPAIAPEFYVVGQTISFWFSAPTDTDFAGYLIWREMTSGFDPEAVEPIRDTTSNTVEIAGAENTAYYFRFAAYDAFSKSDLNVSPEILINTSSLGVDTDPPATPTGLALSSALTQLTNGEQRITLTATCAANTEDDLAGYIFQIKEASGNYVGFSTNTNRYEWTVKPGVSYTVQVAAFDKAGNKSAFATAVTATAAKDTTPPAVPSSFVVLAGTEGFWLSVAANTESDLDHYEFYQASAATPAPVAATVATYKQAGTTQYVGGIAPETTRYFWARAVDTSGNKSAWTAVKSATTPEAEAITTEDLAGLIDETSFAASIAIPGRGTTLPATPFTDDTPTTFYRTTDKTTWVQKTDGSGWVQSTSASLIVGQLVAGQIGANAVGADQIAANAVRAKHMLLTDWNNLVPDNQLIDASSWDFDNRFYIFTPAFTYNSANAFKFVVANKTTNYTAPIKSLPFPVKPNAKYLVAGQAHRVTGTTMQGIFRIVWFPTVDGSGAQISYVDQIFNTTAGGIQALSKEVVAPATARSAKFYYYIYQDNTDGDVNLAGPEVYEKNAAQLIVDGEIKSNHLTTDSAVITNSIQIATAVITKAHIVSLSAAQIEGGTALLGTITVDGRTLSSAANDDVFDNLSAQNWAVSGTGSRTWAGGASPTGSGYLSALGATTNISPDLYPFDPSKLYKITARIRRPSANAGTGVFYSSIRPYDKNKAVLTAWVHGYWVGEATIATDTWLDIVSYVRGTSAAGTSVNNSSVANPAKLVDGTAFLAPVIIFGSGGPTTTGEMQLDSWRVEVVDENAAAVVNAGSVKIDPGQILVSGGTTLADWRFGGDTTKINGGVVAANTLLANTGVFGLRGIIPDGLTFEHNSPSANYVSWTAGTLTYTNDAGTTVTQTITASNAQWTTGTLYVYYTQGATTLSTTTNATTANSSNNVILATYKGGTNLVANYGRTIVDGSGIKTGTVTAVQADIASLRTNILSANVITGAMVQAGTLSARHVVISNSTNLVPDNQMADDASWTKLGAGWVYMPSAAGFTNGRGYIFPYVAGNTGYGPGLQSLPFPVIAGEQYAATVQSYSPGTYGLLARVQFFDASGASLGFLSIVNAQFTAGGVRTHTASIVAPANAKTAVLQYYINRDLTDSAVQVGGPSVKQKDAASLIVDGSVKANHLDVTTLSAISSNIGTMTAGLLQSSDGKFVIDLNNKFWKMVF